MAGLEFNPVDLTGLKLHGNSKDTIYISEPGLYELIFSSQKEEAKKFRQFVIEEILPELRKHGSVSIKNTYNIIKDTTGVKSFYINNNILDYVNKNVVYLAVVGKCNGRWVIKWGKTSQIQIRHFKEHKKVLAQLGDQLDITVSGLEVKENAGLQQSFRLGGVNPAFEVAFPNRQWLAPVGVLGHDPAFAQGVTRLIQPVTDPLAEF